MNTTTTLPTATRLHQHCPRRRQLHDETQGCNGARCRCCQRSHGSSCDHDHRSCREGGRCADRYPTQSHTGRGVRPTHIHMRADWYWSCRGVRATHRTFSNTVRSHHHCAHGPFNRSGPHGRHPYRDPSHAHRHPPSSPRSSSSPSSHEDSPTTGPGETVAKNLGRFAARYCSRRHTFRQINNRPIRATSGA